MKAQLGMNLMKNFMNLPEDKIKNLLATESLDHAKKAKEILEEQKDKYKRGRPKKWVCTFIGVLIGIILGIALPVIY